MQKDTEKIFKLAIDIIAGNFTNIDYQDLSNELDNDFFQKRVKGDFETFFDSVDDCLIGLLGCEKSMKHWKNFIDYCYENQFIIIKNFINLNTNHDNNAYSFLNSQFDDNGCQVTLEVLINDKLHLRDDELDVLNLAYGSKLLNTAESFRSCEQLRRGFSSYLYDLDKKHYGEKDFLCTVINNVMDGWGTNESTAFQDSEIFVREVTYDAIKHIPYKINNSQNSVIKKVIERGCEKFKVGLLYEGVSKMFSLLNNFDSNTTLFKLEITTQEIIKLMNSKKIINYIKKNNIALSSMYIDSLGESEFGAKLFKKYFHIGADSKTRVRSLVRALSNFITEFPDKFDHKLIAGISTINGIMFGKRINHNLIDSSLISQLILPIKRNALINGSDNITLLKNITKAVGKEYLIKELCSVLNDLTKLNKKQISTTSTMSQVGLILDFFKNNGDINFQGTHLSLDNKPKFQIARSVDLKNSWDNRTKHNGIDFVKFKVSNLVNECINNGFIDRNDFIDMQNKLNLNDEIFEWCLELQPDIEKDVIEYGIE